MSASATSPAQAKRSLSPVKSSEMESDGFTKVETREERRKRKKVEKRKPQFQYDLGAFKHGKKIGIAHVRDLILHVSADAPKQNWILVENHSYITHTVVLFVPGLLPSHLGLPPQDPLSIMPFSTSPSTYTDASISALLPPNLVPALSKIFSYGLPTRAPGDQRRLFSPLMGLVNSPLPEGLRKQRDEENKRLAALAKIDNSPPFLYLLTPNQMIDNDYLLPSYVKASDQPLVPGLDLTSLPESTAGLLKRGHTGGAGSEMDNATATNHGAWNHEKYGDPVEGWVETPEAQGPPIKNHYPVLAIDCEMVLTEKGQQLARISVIDFHTNANIFDELVTPSSPIIDYRTQWSGITAARLKNATHTLASIQSTLLFSPDPIITPHTILIGHSLECDLAALKIRHPLCIDTAVIYRHPRGAPFKAGLKWLAGKWLQREIQGSDKGHDSEEDARTCVELLKLKMAHGPDFGSFMDSNESIFERIARYKASDNRTRTTAVCDPASTSRTGYASRATKFVKCENDQEVMVAVQAEVPKHDLVFARLMDLSTALGWNTPTVDPLPVPTGSDTAKTTPAATASSAALRSALSTLSESLTSLHASLPPATALIVLTGHSDPLPMRHLNEKRQKWERLVKTLGGVDDVPRNDKWMAEDERRLEAAVSDAREGMAFFCVK